MKPTSRWSPARLPRPGSGPGERTGGLTLAGRGRCKVKRVASGPAAPGASLALLPPQPPHISGPQCPHPCDGPDLSPRASSLRRQAGRALLGARSPHYPRAEATLMFAGDRGGLALCSSRPDNVIPPPRLCSILPTTGSPLGQLGLPLGTQEASSLGHDPQPRPRPPASSPGLSRWPVLTHGRLRFLVPHCCSALHLWGSAGRSEARALDPSFIYCVHLDTPYRIHPLLPHPLAGDAIID